MHIYLLYFKIHLLGRQIHAHLRFGILFLTGEKCETCVSGYWGNATNDGNCSGRSVCIIDIKKLQSNLSVKVTQWTGCIGCSTLISVLSRLTQKLPSF